MKAKKRLVTLAISSAIGASVLGYFAIATKDSSFLGFADVPSHEISIVASSTFGPSTNYSDGTKTVYTVDGSERTFTYTSMRMDSNRFYMYSLEDKTSELRNSEIIIGSMRSLHIRDIQIPSDSIVDFSLRWSWRDNAFVRHEIISFSSNTSTYTHTFNNELPSFFSLQLDSKDKEVSFQTLSIMFNDADGGCTPAPDLTPVQPNASLLNGLSLTLVGDEYHITGFDGSVTELNIPESFNGIPITNIGSDVLRGSKITKLSVPGSLKTIEDGAFSGLTTLTEIHLAEGIETIGDNAFSGCSSLTEITIPDSVTSLGAYAFNECTNLKEISLSNGMTFIAEGTFTGCLSLETLIIPRSVVTITDKVFQRNQGLKTIFIEHESAPDGFAHNWTKQANNAAVYYYSETPRNGYWHYVDGVPTLW
ncbi:MAG: leucine-rich repeat domain-containing protein [Bacilli bacterium]|jgi:hypothetical protein